MTADQNGWADQPEAEREEAEQWEMNDALGPLDALPPDIEEQWDAMYNDLGL